MRKINVTVNLVVKADPDDEDSIREAVYAKLEEELVDESLEFTIDEEGDGDEESEE